MLMGWIKLEATYQCQWCERVETLVWAGDARPQLNWVFDPLTRCQNICSTDCEKERDACITQTYAALEPCHGKRPKGYEDKFQALRAEKLKMRDLSRRVTESKLRMRGDVS